MPRKKQVVKEEVVEKPEPKKFKVNLYILIGVMGILYFVFLLFYGNSNNDVQDYMTSRPNEGDLKFNADVPVNESTTPISSFPSFPGPYIFDVKLIIAIGIGILAAKTMFWRREIMLQVIISIVTTFVIYYMLQAISPTIPMGPIAGP